jgi:hypothetical protein
VYFFSYGYFEAVGVYLSDGDDSYGNVTDASPVVVCVQ